VLLADGTLGLVMLVLWVFCVADCILSDEARVRSLPKLLWLLIVLVLPDVGSVLWLVLGRPKGAARSMPYKGNAGVPTKYDRPIRAVATNPMTTLSSCANCATAPSSSAVVPSRSAALRTPTRRH